MLQKHWLQDGPSKQEEIKVICGICNDRMDKLKTGRFCVCMCVCYRGLEGLEKKPAVLTFQPDPRPVRLNGLSRGELHLSVKMKAEEE